MTTQQTGAAGLLVAVVVTYNRLDQLKVTLARLLESDPAHLGRIVLVDNASTDGTAAWLAEQDDPRLDLLRSETNTGGAGGFETGMRHAVATYDPDWMVLMDDDGRPEPGALAAFQNTDLTGWDGGAAAVYLPDGDICDMNRPSRNPFWHLRLFFKTMLGGGRGAFHLSPEAYEGPICKIDITSFVGFFVSRRGVQIAGYPDGGLFVYGDDGIYTLELSRAGGRIGFFPGVRFEHDCSTFAGQRGRFRPLWKTYYYHRNLLMMYRLAAGLWFWPALLIVLPKWALKTRQHSGERRAFVRLMWAAVRDGMMRRTTRSHAEVLDLAEGGKTGSDTAESAV